MNNLIARLLFLCGIIAIIIALVYGIIALFSGNPLILFVGILIGLCIIGLAEVVDKVSEMEKKLDLLIEQSKKEGE